MKITNFTHRTLIVLGATTLFGVTHINAQTYVNDTFTDNERATQTPPTSLEWAYASNGALANTTLSASTGALVYTATPGSSAQYDLAYFTASGSPISLLDGQSITLGFQFAFSSIVAGDAIFRFGLFNSNGTRYAAGFSGSTQPFSNNAVVGAGTGYSVETNPGATSGTSNLALKKQAGGVGETTPVSGETTIGTTNAAAYLGLAANTFYNGSLTITRSGTTSLISTTINGVTNNTGSDASGFTSFDEIVFFTGSTAVATNGTFTVDNVNVTVALVPEPSTYAMLLGGAGAIFLFRRRNFRLA